MSISDFSIGWYSVIATTNDISRFRILSIQQNWPQPPRLPYPAKVHKRLKRLWFVDPIIWGKSKSIEKISRIWRSFSGFTENITPACACCLLLRWLWRWHCLQRLAKQIMLFAVFSLELCATIIPCIHWDSSSCVVSPKYDKQIISFSAGVLHELWGMTQCKSKTLCTLDTGTSWFSFHLCASTCAGLAAV